MKVRIIQTPEYTPIMKKGGVMKFDDGGTPEERITYSKKQIEKDKAEYERIVKTKPLQAVEIYKRIQKSEADIAFNEEQIRKASGEPNEEEKRKAFYKWSTNYDKNPRGPQTKEDWDFAYKLAKENPELATPIKTSSKKREEPLLKFATPKTKKEQVYQATEPIQNIDNSGVWNNLYSNTISQSTQPPVVQQNNITPPPQITTTPQTTTASSTPQSNQYNGINPYTGKDAPSKYTKAQWNNFANRIGFKYDPKLGGTPEKQFQQFMYSIPEYKKIIDDLHLANPLAHDKFDGMVGKRWDAALDASQAKIINPTITPSASPKPQLINTDGLPVVNTGVSEDETNKIVPIGKSKFKGDKFDYKQFFPEIYGALTDPNINTFSKKYSPQLFRTADMNIQSQLNDNQADAYYAINSLSGNTRNANVNNIMAQKYAANNNAYNQQYNFNNQARTQTNNQNTQLINQAENINFGRAKTQFDEWDVAKEHKFARQNSLFTSLVGKKAKYDQDQSTKKFWFDILSNNYDYANGELDLNEETTTPFETRNRLNSITPQNLEVKKKTIKDGNTRTTYGKRV